MFGFKRNNSQKSTPEDKTSKPGFFSRLKNGLTKTRQNFTSGLADLVLGSKQIDEDTIEELETLLLTADVGVEATRELIGKISARLERKQLKDSEALINALREDMLELLAPCTVPLETRIENTPYVILMVGVNGVGKTTTIGKLARKFKDDGQKVMLAAGDTFRAAAVEQLQTWGQRNNVPVIAQQSGADSAAVIFDAVEAAKARGVDILIADTAGRLHTQSNLMEELKKIKRVMSKLDDNIPHEVMLVLDAGTGQNALSQATIFNDAVKLTGITLTKLDGTAKGGIVFALAKKLGIPIRFIGIGEGVEDLRPFNAEDFIEALFEKEQNKEETNAST
ncbi:MAG: signal recognition particle-docking protein FtsY [Gammaproteobacteria bacterium]|nr:signal recognition particle-docking protein FtsY [Gammaproteobacteria bacterium]